MLLMLLLVACGDKDYTDTPTDDTGAVTDDTGTAADDTGSASDDTGNGGDDTGGGGESACGDLGGDVACVDVAGTAYTMPGGTAFLGTGSADGLLTFAASQDGYGTPPALTIQYDQTVSAGTLDCTAAPTIITFTDGSEYYGANVDFGYYGASCTITLTATGETIGDAVEGSFVAEMYRNSDGAIISVNGVFKSEVLF